MKPDDLNQEMQAHLEEKIADLMERGLSESDARAQARREFGNRALHLEDSRNVWRWPSLDQLSSDIRYALRGMRRSPGFAAVVIATLAVGIGANTAIFSLVNQLLLHPPGIANPDRIVAIRTRYPKLKLDDIPVSPPTLADVRDSRQVFEHAAMVMGANVNYSDSETPQRLIAAAVTSEWFDVFGLRPMLGRTFHPEEDQPNANHVVVLAYSAWTRLFGSDRSVIGRSILLDGVACQVVGVMNPAFPYPENADLWMPLGLPSALYGANNRFNESYFAVALRKPGVTEAQANAWLGVLTERVRSSNAAWVKGAEWGLFAVPFTDETAGNTRTLLLVLASAVGLVLLIACSNIAGLMLARASNRAHEFAIRSALGAGSGRLLRNMLTESAVLAAAGGAAGLALAYGAMKLLLSLAPESATVGLSPTLDVHALLFCAATVILSGVLFGIVPAWRISRSNPNQALKSGRSTTADPVRQRLRSILVVSETALALVLLAGAGLFLRSIVRLQGLTPGFNPRGVMSASLTLPLTTYSDGHKQAVFYRALLDKLRGAPAVENAALGDPLPFSGGGGSAGFSIDGRVVPPGDPGPHGDVRQVTPGYFETLSIPLLRGRTFTEEDRVNAEGVAVIDETLARRYWPNEDPIGQRIGRPGRYSTIVGIVGHVVHADLASDSGRGTYYYSLYQRASQRVSIVAKTGGGTAPLAAAIREAVREADPHQAIYSLRPMEEMVAESLGSRRFAMRVLGFFAGVALFLAALGLYGVISYGVAQRSREIGIRVALGASSGSVIGEVVGHGLRLAGIGAALGIAGAVLAGKFVASYLPGVAAFDAVTLSAMASVLLFAALIASYLPARRAARVDPVTALRQE